MTRCVPAALIQLFSLPFADEKAVATAEALLFEAALPPDMQELAEVLRQQSTLTLS